MNTKDPYYKKTVSYKHLDSTLQLQVSQELFSSQSVDKGTQRLLRSLIFEKINNYQKVLDLGCGYGPIGLALKASQPESQIHLVDRDALALEYSQLNAQLNNLEPVEIYPSLGYDRIKDTDFDLIISNIPAKVGEPVLTHIIKDAQHFLAPHGKVALVIVEPLADFVHQLLTQDENITITYQHSWPGHKVYHYQFKSSGSESVPLSFDDGIYFRQDTDFSYKNTNYILQTTFNLPEFDRLSHHSVLLFYLLSQISQQVDKALVFNPGQGYLPIAVYQDFNPSELHLVSRDLLGLNISQHNLEHNHFSTSNTNLSHQVGIDIGHSDLDLIAGTLPEQQNLEVYQMYLDQAHQQLASTGQLLLSSSSTVITRTEELVSKHSNFTVVERERDKGQSAILLKKK